MDKKITLEQFIVEAPLMLEAFAAATRIRTEAGEPEFPAGRRADIAWWWAEVMAYHLFVEAEEEYGT